jgi:hypothetical protein
MLSNYSEQKGEYHEIEFAFPLLFLLVKLVGFANHEK